LLKQIQLQLASEIVISENKKNKSGNAQASGSSNKIANNHRNPWVTVPSSQALQDALGGGQRIATQAATGMGMAKDFRDPRGPNETLGDNK